MANSEERFTETSEVFIQICNEESNNNNKNNNSYDYIDDFDMNDSHNIERRSVTISMDSKKRNKRKSLKDRLSFSPYRNTRSCDSQQKLKNNDSNKRLSVRSFHWVKNRLSPQNQDTTHKRSKSLFTAILNRISLKGKSTTDSPSFDTFQSVVQQDPSFFKLLQENTSAKTSNSKNSNRKSKSFTTPEKITPTKSFKVVLSKVLKKQEDQQHAKHSFYVDSPSKLKRLTEMKISSFSDEGKQQEKETREKPKSPKEKTLRNSNSMYVSKKQKRGSLFGSACKEKIKSLDNNDDLIELGEPNSKKNVLKELMNKKISDFETKEEEIATWNKVSHDFNALQQVLRQLDNDELSDDDEYSDVDSDAENIDLEDEEQITKSPERTNNLQLSTFKIPTSVLPAIKTRRLKDKYRTRSGTVSGFPTDTLLRKKQLL